MARSVKYWPSWTADVFGTESLFGTEEPAAPARALAELAAPGAEELGLVEPQEAPTPAITRRRPAERARPKGRGTVMGRRLQKAARSRVEPKVRTRDIPAG